MRNRIFIGIVLALILGIYAVQDSYSWKSKNPYRVSNFGGIDSVRIIDRSISFADLTDPLVGDLVLIGDFTVGTSSSTDPRILSIFDGGADNEAGQLVLYDDGGEYGRFWVNTANVLRGITNSAMTDDDADGYAIIDLDNGTIGASGQPGVFSTLNAASTMSTGASGGTSGQVGFIASDNDQGIAVITTADALDFTGFTGGVLIDGTALLIPDFAGLYMDGGGEITVLLVNGFEQVTTFDTDQPEVVSNGAHGTDDITIGATGVYEIAFNASALSAANNKAFEFFVFELDASPVGTQISGITKADPAQVTTSTAHGLSNGNRVKLDGVVGMTEVEDNIYTVANQTEYTFTLDVDDGTDVNSSAYVNVGTDGSVYLATKLIQIHSHRTFGVNSDQGAFSGGGLASLTASKTLELYFKGTTDATNLTIQDCSFYMKRVQ